MSSHQLSKPEMANNGAVQARRLILYNQLKILIYILDFEQRRLKTENIKID